MNQKVTTHAEPPKKPRRLYQLIFLVWTIYALSALARLLGLGIIARAIVPGRPEWTRWTLPLIGGTFRGRLRTAVIRLGHHRRHHLRPCRIRPARTDSRWYRLRALVGREAGGTTTSETLRVQIISVLFGLAAAAIGTYLLHRRCRNANTAPTADTAPSTPATPATPEVTG